MNSQDIELPKPGWSVSVFRVPPGETKERWERVINGSTDKDYVDTEWNHLVKICDTHGWKIRMSFVEVREHTEKQIA